MHEHHPNIIEEIEVEGVLSTESEHTFLSLLPEFVNNFIVRQNGAS
jgi:hypothetical protein